eukprot:IDg16988t1
MCCALASNVLLASSSEHTRRTLVWCAVDTDASSTARVAARAVYARSGHSQHARA